MAAIDIPLELIDDNPYNPRKHYPQAKVKEMAQSLREVGLRQAPEGRHVDGRVQLAYGHMRLRGFRENQKREPSPENEKWKMMLVHVKEISDQDMFHYSMEENLRRTDITPIEVARCIEAFSEMFPDVTEKDLGKKHNMSEANVSNMKRVLRLPEKILEKIDDVTITFTQGRELLIFERFENAQNLMRSALDGLKIGNKAYGEPNTVDGLQKSIHSVISGHCRPLDKEWEGSRWDILFDTRATGCLECDKMVRTHPTKSATAHYCTDAECWDRHQEEHREKAAAEAKAKMQAEVINQAAQMIAQEEKAPPLAPVMIDENTVLVDQETFAKIEASYSGDRISEGTAVRRPVEFEGKLYVATGSGMGKVEAYQLVPREQFTGAPRTYRVPAGREDEEYYESLRNDPNGFYHGMLVKRGKEEHVLVGPGVTFVTKVTKVDEGDFSQEKLPSQVEVADETDRFLEKQAITMEEKQAASRLKQLESMPDDYPCKSCKSIGVCSGEFVYMNEESKFACDQHWPVEGVAEALLKQDISRRIAEAPAPAPQEIPEDILTLAKERAGTRAEVLDLNDICSGGGYWRQAKQGYAILDDELRLVDDPAECLERCTHGFHYAFDSKAKEQKEIHICSDTKCLAKKKAAFTHAKNAEGQARKKAETKAIKQAIDLVGQVISDGKQLLDEEGKFTNTVMVPRATLKLILLSQMKGAHISKYAYSGEKYKLPSALLWDKVSAGTPENDRTTDKLFKAIDKLTDDELAKLVVEFMFYYLTDKGDIGSYEIKVTEPLKWMGVDMEEAQKET